MSPSPLLDERTEPDPDDRVSQRRVTVWHKYGRAQLMATIRSVPSKLVTDRRIAAVPASVEPRVSVTSLNI